jgi:hypothetical protein
MRSFRDRSAIACRDAGCRSPSSTPLDAAARDQHGGVEGSAYGIIRHPAVDEAGSVVAEHNGDVGALELPLERVHHGALAARRGRARCALVSGASLRFSTSCTS